TLVVSDSVNEMLLIYISIITSILQALFSAYLIKSAGLCSKYSSNNLFDVLKINFLAGPVGCLLSSSSIAVAFIVLENDFASEVLFYWSSWWAADVMGIIASVPFILRFSFSDKKRKETKSKRFAN